MSFLNSFEFFKNKKIINLTPHEIVLVRNREKIIFPKSNEIVRLEEEDKKINDFLVLRKYNLPQNFPKIQENVLYIVSLPILLSVKRKDFIAPDTGSGAIRDKSGRIIGTTRFITIYNEENKEE